MSNDLYQEIILEEFAHPQFFGKMADADLTIPGINPSCGDAMMMYVKLDPQKKFIEKLLWDGEGCAISIAAMSTLAAKINQEHTTLAELIQIKKEMLEEMLGMDEIIPGRAKCLMLGLHTLQTFFAEKQ